MELPLPVRQYGKRQLFNELKSKQLISWSYNKFMQWVYSDPLCSEIITDPTLKKRKILMAKEARKILMAVI